MTSSPPPETPPSSAQGQDPDALGRLADEIAAAEEEGAAFDASARARDLGLGPEEAGSVQAAARALGRLLRLGAEDPEGAEEEDAGVPSPPPRLPEEYELLGEIGRGGMGIVYRARQRSLSRLVAVKVLRPGGLLFGQSLRRFRREARSLARLRHPHIVSIHDVGEADGHVWYTMDLIEGRSLAQLLEEGPLGVARATRLVKQVAGAIAYVHAHGIVHRDLKPANVLVDESGDAVVTDFGLALELGQADGLTLTGQVLGTPAYMSPEQARGDTEAIGEATDVYALGVLLYECLTGRRPFAGTSPAEQVYAVIHRDPPPPRRLERRVPEDLEVVCLQAMRKRAQDRYPTVGALLEDLERVEQGRAIRARPPTRAYRVGRFARRHRSALAGSALGFALAAVVVGLWVLPGARRDATALREAAAALEAQGEVRAALQVLERAEALAGEVSPDPDRLRAGVRLRLEVARRAWEAGDAARALVVLDRAVAAGEAAFGRGDRPGRERWPEAGPVHFARATALALLGRAQEADVAFNRALQLWSESGGGHAYSSPAPPWRADLVRGVLASLAHPERPGWAAARVQALALWANAYLPGPVPGIVLSEDPEQAAEQIQGYLELQLPRLGQMGKASVWVSQLRREVSSFPLGPTVEHLEVLASDPARTPLVRRGAAILLAALLDVPHRAAFVRDDPAQATFDPVEVVDAVRRIRTLPRLEAYRARLALAASEREALEREAEQRWSSGAAKAPWPEGQAVHDLSGWLSRHMPGVPVDGGSEWRAAYEQRREEDPRRLLASALGLAGVPTWAEAPGLVARFVPLRDDDLACAWLHHLLALLVPAEIEPPLWRADEPGHGSLHVAWRTRLSGEPGFPPARGRLRHVRIAQESGGWRVLEGTSLFLPVEVGSPFVLRHETGARPPPEVWVRLSAPGLGKAGGAPVTHLELHAALAWAENGLTIEVRESVRRTVGSWSGSSGNSDRSSAAYALSPDLNVGGWSSPDPFRLELALVLLEPEEADAQPWPLERWTERLGRDLTDLALRLEVGEAPRAPEVPALRHVNRVVYDEQHTLSNLLGVATHLPLPGALDALRRIDRVLLGPAGPGGRRGGGPPSARTPGEGPLLDHQSEMALLARLMAGDEAAQDEPGFPERLDAMEREGIALTTAGRGGEYEVRLLRLTASERLRDLARERLARFPLSARAAGDLLDAAREGIALPEALGRRLSDGPTEDRSFAGLLASSPVLAGLAGAVLLAGAALTVLVLHPSRRLARRLVPAAWLVVVGMVLLAWDLWVSAWDVLPDVLGAAWIALGAGVLATSVRAPVARAAAVLFALQALSGLLAPAAGTLAPLAGALTAAGVVGLLLLAHALRGGPDAPPVHTGALPGAARRRRPLPLLFALLYVLPLGAGYALGAWIWVTGSPDLALTLHDPWGPLLLLVLALCVVFVLRRLVLAAAIRRTWLEVPRAPRANAPVPTA